MKLQLRLALAALALVMVFLGTFWLAWNLVGGPEATRPPRDLAQRMRIQSSQVYQKGGWKATQSGLRNSPMPFRSAVAYDLEQRPQVVEGQSLEADPDRFRETLEKGCIERLSMGGPELWARIDGADGKPVGALRLVLAHRNHPEQRWLYAYSVVLSASIAAAASLLAGWWASRALARPVADLVVATRALAGSDFTHRLPVSGSGELLELAQSFNLMAESLERTILSLTEAKERAEKSEASRRQFMADVSHNLRTPLTAMLGWTEALVDGLAPGEERVHLLNLRDETIYLAQNVQRLTDWSRWEDRPPTLQWEEFPVSEPLMDCLQSLESQAQRKEIELQLSGLEDEPKVRGDRIRVRELFQLLLENAINHNSSGTLLRVAFSKAGERLKVSVADNGSGLPEELRQDLECRVGGGLGLAIASRLARAHGGQLKLQESLQGGTELSFTLESPK